MKLVPYEPLHYVQLANQAGSAHVLTVSTIEMVANFHFFKGVGFSAVLDNQVVGSAGIVELWPGVGEAWTMLTDQMRAHPFFLHRRVLRMMRDLIRYKKYHRLHASVNLADGVAVKWVERLGFEFEARLKKFSTSQEDYGVYALFPGGG